MKKGFTLIELLAVIIILAVVALIATPIVLDVIEDARISTGRSEASIIYNGINNYCLNEEMAAQLDPLYTRICTSDMDKDDVPTMVNLGSATIDELVYDGEKLTTLVITSNKHKFTLCPSGTFAMDDEECKIVPESLISLLLKQYDKSNTKGLVKDSTNENLYYYTGTNEEVTNNFLWYGGHQWRVLEFNNSDNTITLITQQPLTSIQPASAVWTTQEEYESSYINSWLNEYFWNSLESGIQNNILDSTFNVGIYTDIDEITTIQKVGLINEEQYVKSGTEKSFLNIGEYFWISNRGNSTLLRYVHNDGGYLASTDILRSLGIRPIIKISDITIMAGNGTLENSYRVENKVSNTNDVQVGEYINVPYIGSDNACGSDNMCTFRIVSKNNDSIKVVLNGLLPTTSVWANNANDNITTTDLIYTNILNSFIVNIDSKYVTTGTYGVGMYESGSSFLEVKNSTIEAVVGLPTIGELFSGNDIDLKTGSLEKMFVDVNTIENPTSAYNYWMMNRYNASSVRYVDFAGYMSVYDPSAESGVRPVIYLKSGLMFISGNGTAQSPYELE